MPGFSLNVNNKKYTVEAEADMPLLWVLRDLLDLTGTKYGCGVASCGACTVMMDGNSIMAFDVKVWVPRQMQPQIIDCYHSNLQHAIVTRTTT